MDIKSEYRCEEADPPPIQTCQHQKKEAVYPDKSCPDFTNMITIHAHNA